MSELKKENSKGKQDKMSVIFGIINEQCRYSAQSKTDSELLLKRVISRGFSPQDLREVVDIYSRLGVVME